MAGRSLRAFAGLIGVTSVSGMAEVLGVSWPPPPPISVRELMNLALVRSGVIKHVFVLVLENRSFDHMLGASTGTVDGNGVIHPGTGVDAVTGQPTTVNAAVGQTNAHDGTVFHVRAGAPFVMPVDPPHEFCDVQLQLASTAISGRPLQDQCAYSGAYPPLTMAGFVENYYNQATVEAADPDPSTQQAGQAALADLGAVMACLSPAQVPVLSALASQFAVCDQWYSALPGPTWPNRFFLHAATSGGLDHSPSSWEAGISLLDGYKFENGTIYDALDSRGLGWSVYHGDDLPQILALHGMDLLTVATHFHDLSDLAADLQDPGFSAAYVFIEPNYGHVLTDGGNFQCGNSQHPIDDVTRGEALIKYVYESIRQSPHWQSSLLVITYDEHGGFYDHVPPPPAVAPGDITDPGNNVHGFQFDQQGVRVPAVIVSPWIPLTQVGGAQTCNLIDHTRYDHGSLLATVERLYGLSPLTARDAQANDLIYLLSVPARQDAPLTLPDPAVSGFTCGDDQPAGRVSIPRTATPTRGVQRSEIRRETEAADAAAAAARPLTAALRGFVEITAIQDARLHPTERERIERRIRTIHTLGQAHAYMSEVTAQSQAAQPPSRQADL